MKRTYEADDSVFQKLRATGKSSWDEQSDPEASFDRFVMRPFLEEVLAGLASPLHELSALEIGCGSGPISCFLAASGLAVRGIDVSPTAIEMARQNAVQRGINVSFELADICRLPERRDRYDLVVDGHCLHCLVWDEHRRDALAAIHRLLKPTGLFVIETMLTHANLLVGGNYRIDPDGVLSIRVDAPAGVEGVFRSGGEWFAPYRRLRTADEVAAELGDAGFAVKSTHASAQKDPRKPMLLRVRASHRPT